MLSQSHSLSFLLSSAKVEKKTKNAKYFNEIFRLFALPVEGGAATTVW
jgi:hypothetical protein